MSLAPLDDIEQKISLQLTNFYNTNQVSKLNKFGITEVKQLEKFHQVS